MADGATPASKEGARPSAEAKNGKPQDDLELKLNRLLSSSVIIETSTVPLRFKLPTLGKRQISEYYYNAKLKECENIGVLNVDDTIKEHRAHGLWSKEKDEQLIKLPEFIQETIDNIKITKQPSKIKELQEWQTTLEKIYGEVLLSKHAILANSAEYLANDALLSCLVYSCVCSLEGQKVWKSYQDFLQTENVDFIKELILLINYNLSFLTIPDIRRIARLPTWRIRWNTCKTSMRELFGRTASNLSNEQLLLVYWSQVYDSAYEAMERPPDEIIENDEEFDGWLEEESKKRKLEIGQRFYGKGQAKKSKIDDSSEVFKNVMGYWKKNEGEIKDLELGKYYYVYYSEKERWDNIEKTRSLNSPVSRAIKRREEEELRRRGPHLYREEHIRKDDYSRQMMGGNITKKGKG